MAQPGSSFNFGARPNKIGPGKKVLLSETYIYSQKPDARSALPATGTSRQVPAQITPSKEPSRKKSFAKLRKLSIFNLRKPKFPDVAPQTTLSEGPVDLSTPAVSTPAVDAATQDTMNKKSANSAIRDSDTGEYVIPPSPSRQPPPRPSLPTPLVQRTSVESLASLVSTVSFHSENIVSQSESRQPHGGDDTATKVFGVLMVPRKGPPSPASSFIEPQSRRAAKIIEISDDDDKVSVPTTMPPSPPISTTYSYVSFPETFITAEDNYIRGRVSSESETTPELGDPMEISPSTSQASLEQSPRLRPSSVRRGKRPVGMFDFDWDTATDGNFGYLMSQTGKSIQKAPEKQKKSSITIKGKAVEKPPELTFDFGARSTARPTADSTRVGPSKYGILAGLQQMKNEERRFADELRRIEEDDRVLAEALQRIEDEAEAEALQEEEEQQRDWERMLLIDDEEERLRKERLERISKEDALLAKAMMEQEEAELEEQRRLNEERERLQRQERELQLAEERRIILATREIGAAVGVRRVEANATLTPLGLSELNADVIAQLKNVRTTFSTWLPAHQIVKVEWIINEKLRAQFETCREQLRQTGRSTQEILLWHGTQAANTTP